MIRVDDQVKSDVHYEIVKSEWEIFSKNKRIRVKRIISWFKYTSRKEAQKVAVELRKKDPHYKYDLGDRIYVRRSKYDSNR